MFDLFENRRVNCFLLLALSVVVALGLIFMTPENSLVRASKSVLRIIGYDVALFLWRARLGNDDQQAGRVCDLSSVRCCWFGH